MKYLIGIAVFATLFYAAYAAPPCTHEGEMFADTQGNCSVYVQCDAALNPIRRPCAPGTEWRQQDHICVHPEQSDCSPTAGFCAGKIAGHNYAWPGRNTANGLCHRYLACVGGVHPYNVIFNPTPMDCPAGLNFKETGPYGYCTYEHDEPCPPAP
ncbi:predicted protein [Nematostella vectensis]|uniref:Chitin-binding type-2 domain-containing protein n=1 Tax=Nematostella vectensis TaxID=45351 RepID=A7RL58_NEMVE|nr:predicted protein [Nematostella vectensis]|eukprot:XP_001639935.1 predicted protein [Nematostella vectensis]